MNPPFFDWMLSNEQEDTEVDKELSTHNTPPWRSKLLEK
jgi:hypothetical protein